MKPADQIANDILRRAIEANASHITMDKIPSQSKIDDILIDYGDAEIPETVVMEQRNKTAAKRAREKELLYPPPPSPPKDLVHEFQEARKLQQLNKSNGDSSSNLDMAIVPEGDEDEDEDEGEETMDLTIES